MTVPVRRPVVVVAEDDPIARSLIVAEVTRAGYQAMAHYDGLSALTYLAMGERADALVTDVHMPGSIDGLFLAVEARSQRPLLPVVYLSARSIAAQAMVPGARFLPKPYPIGGLANLLGTVMGASAARMTADSWSLRVETRRRYLVANDGWMTRVVDWRRVTDLLVSELGGFEVCVSIDGERARLLVKGSLEGLRRRGFECEVPLAQAEMLLGLAYDRVVRIKHSVPDAGADWEVDAYQGALDGFVIAEVPLAHDAETPELPSWIGREVTGDPRFGSTGLATLGWRSA